MSLKEFFEASTIHGFAYLTSKSRLARPFWIIVVISGFSFAGILIYQSFQAWNESPVKTTIETRPINEIKFPKVTVCPPKNTFTNLNYDLQTMGDKKVGGDDSWKILKDYVKYSQNEDAKKDWKNFQYVHHEEMLKSWYNDKLGNILASFEDAGYYIWISASNKLKEKVFYPDVANKNKFMEEDFQTHSNIRISIRNPFVYYYSELKQTEGTYIIKVNYDIEPEVEELKFMTTEEFIDLDPKNNNFSMNISKPRTPNPFSIQFRRNMDVSNLRKWTNRRYTGFSLEWEYVPSEYENYTIVNLPKCAEKCETFKHFANVLHTDMVDPEELTLTVEDVMSDWILGYVNEVEENCWRHCDLRKILMEVVFKRLGISEPPDISIKYNVSEENLEIAGKLMMLLFAKETGTWQTTLDNFQERLKDYSLRTLLQTLALEVEDKNKKLVFDGLVRTFDLKVNNINQLITGNLGQLNASSELGLMNSDIFEIINHPVHIVDKNMNLSPSSFVPFCEFGGNMSALGVKIDQFDVPVCNSFQAKILNDQLCYEVDVNEIISKPFTANDLKLGLALLIDENWDRQYNLTMPSTESSGKIFEEFKRP